MDSKYFLKKRCIAIAQDTSGKFCFGDIFTHLMDNTWEMYHSGRWNGVKINFPEQFPHLFRPLKWFEHRTIEELNQIMYIKIISSGNYWIPGDVVPVSGVLYGLNGARKAIQFDVGIGSVRFFDAEAVEPATKEDYEAFKTKNKIS